MKSLSFALYLFIIMSGLALSTDRSLIPYLNVDPDTLTPFNIHEYLAQSKADNLDRARALSRMESVSYFDQAEYDVIHYNLFIDIDLENEYVDSAMITVTARSMIDNLSMLELDFVDSIPDPLFYPDSIYLRVDSAYSGGDRLWFAHENNRVIIELDRPYNLGEEFTFTVRYHGHPWAQYRIGIGDNKSHGRGLAFGRQNALFDPESDILVAYTDCQPYDSKRWWPCKDRPDDKPDSMDIFVAISTPYYCASNGKLISISPIKATGERRLFHYKTNYPIYTSVVSLAISDYTIWTDWYYYGDNDSMPVVNHIYPYYYEDALDEWSITTRCLQIYSEAFGQYPFVNDKYGHAQYENFGMEHQTLTAMPSLPWAHTNEYLIIHEMAHQWWGDMITCKSWHDVWLNEGFGTYSEAIYYEGLSGESRYHSHMANLEYWGDRSVYIYDTTYASEVFNIVVYHKGAWVLHMLRHYIGDEMFFGLIHAYNDSEYKYGSLTTVDFIEFCNTFTGQDLTEFFNDWVYGILYPVYGSAYMSEQDLSDGQYWVYYYLMQGQTYGPEVFDMPVDLTFYDGADIIKDTSIFCDARMKMHIFKTLVPPDSIVLDRDNWILKKKFKMQWTYHLIPFPLDTANRYEVYLDTIICRGGSGYNTFQIVDGNLPDGLALDAGTGILSGTSEIDGDFYFTVRADDIYSSSFDELEYNLKVRESAGWPGDANLDSKIDILDIVFLINYKYKNGPVPPSPSLADPNADCEINILDIVFLINYLYKGGPIPRIGCAE